MGPVRICAWPRSIRSVHTRSPATADSLANAARFMSGESISPPFDHVIAWKNHHWLMGMNPKTFAPGPPAPSCVSLGAMAATSAQVFGGPLIPAFWKRSRFQ